VTTQQHADRFKTVTKEMRFFTSDVIFPKVKGGKKGLLHGNEFESLSSALICWHTSNSGVSHKEPIALVQELVQTVDRIGAENHFAHQVWMKRSNGVKRHGHVIKAQPQQKEPKSPPTHNCGGMAVSNRHLNVSSK